MYTGMMMGSLADENNGSLQWRESMADAMCSKSLRPNTYKSATEEREKSQTVLEMDQNGVPLNFPFRALVTNACSTAVNIQSNRNQRARFVSDRNIRRNNTRHDPSNQHG